MRCLLLLLLSSCATLPTWSPVCVDYALLEVSTIRNARNMEVRIVSGLNVEGHPHATGQVRYRGEWRDLGHDSYTVFIQRNPEMSEIWRTFSPEEWAGARRHFVMDVK